MRTCPPSARRVWAHRPTMAPEADQAIPARSQRSHTGTRPRLANSRRGLSFLPTPRKDVEPIVCPPRLPILAHGVDLSVCQVVICLTGLLRVTVTADARRRRPAPCIRAGSPDSPWMALMVGSAAPWLRLSASTVAAGPRHRPRRRRPHPRAGRLPSAEAVAVPPMRYRLGPATTAAPLPRSRVLTIVVAMLDELTDRPREDAVFARQDSRGVAESALRARHTGVVGRSSRLQHAAVARPLREVPRSAPARPGIHRLGIRIHSTM